jgi:outer membrane protein assembly factor BamB
MEGKSCSRTISAQYTYAMRHAVLTAAFAVAAFAQNWPQFRGEKAAGVADGQNLPSDWNIVWKTEIPGLGHSSTIVWGDRVFLTTAISSDKNFLFEAVAKGPVDMRTDAASQQWRVYCLDRKSGKILWERLASEGVPDIHRHPHNSYASETPATDGEHVVVSFGSQGLYCYNFKGDLLWKKDLGVIHAGKHNNPEYTWGTASSPVIYGKKAIVLCDSLGDGYLAAFDVDTGREVWRTRRDANPSWSTPGIFEGDGKTEVVVNASPLIQSYDLATGKELWRLGPSSTNTTPTPVFGEGLMFVANGYNPIKPIYAVRPGARGDLTLKGDATSSDAVAWSDLRNGPYMATPLLYRGVLYVVSINGVLTAFEAKTGKQFYQKRIAPGGFTASPVASDGRIYIGDEEGNLYVVKAGAEFEILGKKDFGEVLMATPAISQSMMVVRTQHHVWAVAASSKHE